MKHSNKVFKCKILKNTDVLFNGDVLSLILDSSIGTLEILKDHAEIYAILVPGDIVIQKSDKSNQTFQVTRGTLHFRDNVATLLVHIDQT